MKKKADKSPTGGHGRYEPYLLAHAGRVSAPKTAGESRTREATDSAKAAKLRNKARAPIGAIPEEITEAVEGEQSLLTNRKAKK